MRRHFQSRFLLYTYVGILIVILIGAPALSQYLNHRSVGPDVEAFNPSREKLILLGDSTLKNNAYVATGMAIEDILQNKTIGNTFSYAKDFSVIQSVYKQLDQIPNTMNGKYTSICLSIGGNDIINAYKYDNVSLNDLDHIGVVFKEYEKLVRVIQAKMNLSRIFLVDAYYPVDITYSRYTNVLTEWNSKIYNFANIQKNNISGVVMISEIVTTSDDIVHKIEPSITGGDDIANQILLTI